MVRCPISKEECIFEACAWYSRPMEECSIVFLPYISDELKNIRISLEEK